MASRVACWIHGHRWGPWEPRLWENLLGWQYRVRFCDQCGAMDRRTA